VLNPKLPFLCSSHCSAINSYGANTLFRLSPPRPSYLAPVHAVTCESRSHIQTSVATRTQSYTRWAVALQVLPQWLSQTIGERFRLIKGDHHPLEWVKKTCSIQSNLHGVDRLARCKLNCIVHSACLWMHWHLCLLSFSGLWHFVFTFRLLLHGLWTLDSLHIWSLFAGSRKSQMLSPPLHCPTKWQLIDWDSRLSSPNRHKPWHWLELNSLRPHKTKIIHGGQGLGGRGSWEGVFGLFLN